MSKSKRPLIRALEILPGALAWGTFIAAPILSYFHPAWVSLYIIVFDLYWFFKGGNVAVHLIYSYHELKVHNKIDWRGWLTKLSNRNNFLSYLQTELKKEKRRGYRRLYRKNIEQISKLPKERALDWTQIYHVVVLAMVKEGIEVLRP